MISTHSSISSFLNALCILNRVSLDALLFYEYNYSNLEPLQIAKFDWFAILNIPRLSFLKDNFKIAEHDEVNQGQ